MTSRPEPRRIALVTGAGAGLGEVIAGRLHAAGYAVGLADLDGAAAIEAARRLDPHGGSAVGITLDVRDKGAFQAALGQLSARWGAVHALVNNAAVTIARPVMDISPEEFDAVLAVNLRGTFLGCQVFGGYFRDEGHGRIVNLASLAGQNGGTATGAHYAASKGAILTLTKVFARDLGPSGVTVNAIAPGPLDLPALHRTVSPERLVEIKKMIPVGGVGDPVFVADMVVQLAAPEAAFANGATIDLNGGLYMR